ncbi:MAG: hypothetical protein GX220_01105 [Treponema sp.]|jgi:hypothetical protein|nr:hypothetical protein [Treponema sp.]
MKKKLTLILLCFFVLGFVFAQTENEVQPEEDDEYEYVYKANQGGDSYIRMSLAVDIPLKPEIPKMKVGGSGTLGFAQYLNSWFALGGDFSFAYSETIGSNVYYFVPIMFRATAQLTLDKFELPLTIGLGGSFQNYVDRLYFGLTIQPEVGIFYRFRPDWSIGAMCGLYILPQWYKNQTYNYIGYILTGTIGVRYHF